MQQVNQLQPKLKESNTMMMKNAGVSSGVMIGNGDQSRDKYISGRQMMEGATWGGQPSSQNLGTNPSPIGGIQSQMMM